MLTHARRPFFSWLSGRKRSFAYALRGLAVLCQERNAQIHFAATVFVVCAGVLLRLTRLEWVCVTIAVTAVWVTEAFNTALERLSDAAVPRVHPLVEAAKDVAAGAVLLAAAGALCIGGLVFIPRLAQWIHP